MVLVIEKNKEFEDWFLSSRGKERKIAERFVSFLKSKKENSKFFTLVKGIIRPSYVTFFSPDIDVLEINPNNELIAYEIKLLRGKRVEYIKGFAAEKKQIIKQIVREPSKTDPAIYTGLGEALFNLQNADFSYLVIPEPGLNYELESLIKHLPIGLIVFSKDLNFIIKKEASESDIYPIHKEDILRSDKDKPRYPTVRGKLWFSKKF